MRPATRHSPAGIPLVGGRPPPTAPLQCATVLIAQLSAYGDLIAHRPAQDMARLLDEFFSEAARSILKYGGQVLSIANNRLTAGFGVGDRRRSRVEDAMAAAREMQRNLRIAGARRQFEPALTMNVAVGIDRGEVAIRPLTLPDHEQWLEVGNAVNTRERLAQRTRPGEILMTDAAYRAFAGADFLNLGPLRLPGCSAAVEAWCSPLPERLG